jgi:hypothetical protein
MLACKPQSRLIRKCAYRRWAAMLRGRRMARPSLMAWTMRGQLPRRRQRTVSAALSCHLCLGGCGCGGRAGGTGACPAPHASCSACCTLVSVCMQPLVGQLLGQLVGQLVGQLAYPAGAQGVPRAAHGWALAGSQGLWQAMHRAEHKQPHARCWMRLLHVALRSRTGLHTPPFRTSPLPSAHITLSTGCGGRPSSPMPRQFQ